MDLSWDAPQRPTPACLPSLSPGARASGKGHALARQQRRRGDKAARDKFARLSGKWNKRALLDPSRPHLGSWLAEGSECRLSGWGLGCTVCAAAGCSTAWALFEVKRCNLSNVAQHAQSSQHRAAVLRQLDSVASAPWSSLPPPEPLRTPTAADFLKILQARTLGNSYKSSSVVCSEEKALRMTWCLAEGLRDEDRSFLRESAVVALHQDARTADGLMLIRFQAVNAKLEARAGVLGVTRDHGTTAAEV